MSGTSCDHQRVLRNAMNTAAFTIVQPRFHFPALCGVIDRRMLVNFRVEASALARLLPQPFRPKLVQGCGIAGICLIRLRKMRPASCPARFGFTSENAAHRVAVEWMQNGLRREGVFIPRRDTSSWLNRLAGGRVFPGLHHAADFTVEETEDRFAIAMRSRDGAANLWVTARLADALPLSSLFQSLREASAFFESGAVGWSVGARPGEFDGLELRSFNWSVEPLAVEDQLDPPDGHECDGSGGDREAGIIRRVQCHRAEPCHQRGVHGDVAPRASPVLESACTRLGGPSRFVVDGNRALPRADGTALHSTAIPRPRILF